MIYYRKLLDVYKIQQINQFLTALMAIMVEINSHLANLTLQKTRTTNLLSGSIKSATLALTHFGNCPSDAFSVGYLISLPGNQMHFDQCTQSGKLEHAKRQPFMPLNIKN